MRRRGSPRVRMGAVTAAVVAGGTDTDRPPKVAELHTADIPSGGEFAAAKARALGI